MTLGEHTFSSEEGSDLAGHWADIDELRTDLVERIVEDAEFVYQTREKKPAMLGIDDILVICGHDILTHPKTRALPLFEGFREKAIRVHEMSERHVEVSRGIGKQALDTILSSRNTDES